MSKRADSRAAYLLGLPRQECRALLERMGEREKQALASHWRLWAHEGQLPPGGDWLIWLILAGRGFGKTRAGAEWVRALAESDPSARIALVGASLGEARAVMVEGESGLLAVAPRGRRPRYEPSKRQLLWPGGARATLYSAGEPESLRGPQHSHARRADAERDIRQRGVRADRYPASLRGRGSPGQSSGHLGGRDLLADRRGCGRRMGRQ